MCGIIGILGKQPVVDALVDALKRLEYRGYDSAGVSTLEEGKLARRRAQGKLRNLEALLATQPLRGTAGIGHTRWATHGVPSERNAHPHMTSRISLVHNGIIENFHELRTELEADGAQFETETDTEAVVHLIHRELASGASPEAAVAETLRRLEGAFALAMLFAGEEDLLVGARRGSPLAIGYGDGEMYLGSDAMALAPFTNRVAYLEEGDWVALTRTSVRIRDEQGNAVERPVQITQASALLADKGNHRHFMAKEIHEQPDVIARTLGHYVHFAKSRVELMDTKLDFSKLSRLTISACGTAYYAGMMAKYWFERYARLRSISMSHPNSATARRRCRRTAWRCSFRNPAKPPIRSPACATRKNRPRRSSQSSTCRNRPSRGNWTPFCRRSPGRKSVSPRRRRSPASLRFWPAWR